MEKTETVCPPWVGRLMVSPLRKWVHNPHKILSPFIKSGDIILEIGPGMGFFSIPMAQMTGKTGKVLCVDVQEPMLQSLSKRAEKYKVDDQIKTHRCNTNSLNIEHLNEQIDFALLFAVVHEIPDQQKLFNECYAALKPGGKILFAEPKGHVKETNWRQSLSFAKEAGFKLQETSYIRSSISKVLVK